MRQGVGYVGQTTVQYRRHREFVLGIDDRPQEAHGNRFDTPFGELCRGGVGLFRIEWRVYLAFRGDAFADLEGQASRHIGRRIVRSKVVGIGLAAFPEQQNIGEAFRGEECCLRRLAFDDGVGRMRGAVDKDLRATEQCRELLSLRVRCQLQRRLHADKDSIRRGQSLLDGANAGLVGYDHIGEGASCVDRNAVGAHGSTRRRA